MTQEEFQRLAGAYLEQLGRREPDPAWGAEARAWALERGLIAGDEVYYAYTYDNPARTPAPEGYEPFYISHYGRHGSRWLLRGLIGEHG